MSKETRKLFNTGRCFDGRTGRRAGAVRERVVGGVGMVCESVLFAADAGDCWRRIVEAGLNDPRKLLSRFDHELEALGIPPDAIPCLRRGLGRYREQ